MGKNGTFIICPDLYPTNIIKQGPVIAHLVFNLTTKSCKIGAC